MTPFVSKMAGNTVKPPQNGGKETANKRLPEIRYLLGNRRARTTKMWRKVHCCGTFYQQKHTKHVHNALYVNMWQTKFKQFKY